MAYGAARLALRLAVAGGAWRRPRRFSVAERLKDLPSTGLPIDSPVEIRWHDRLVPFIEARSDRDLAVALGLVHGHLRLAQMELLRLVAHGRLAAALGPLAVPLDQLILTFEVTRAVPAIRAGLPAATREWLGGYVAGINHHLRSDAPPPPEFGLLGIAAAPWQVDDVLAVGRLVAADVNWLVLQRLLPLRREQADDWPAMWAQVLGDGTLPITASAGGAARSAPVLARLLLGLGHAGSNALAVAGRRSTTGRPWLAGDPHLLLSLPNIWLQMAYRSPSYQVAGLMIAGIPAMAIGRNPALAWGGTNLMAASSELLDVSALPPSEIRTRRLRLDVRWAKPLDMAVRETAYGPVISDLPLFAGRDGEMLALRWVGHQPSDEISALLAMNRARDAAAFRDAAGGLAVPGQNLIFADENGHIGRLCAAWLPRRTAAPPADLVCPPVAAPAWDDLATAADLPAERDPPRGFVVSANDAPAATDIPIGWFFASPERAERLRALLRASERIGVAELAALQTDVAAPAMLAFRDCLVAAHEPPLAGALGEALVDWDGRYDCDSRGALAIELVLARLTAISIPPHRQALYRAVC